MGEQNATGLRGMAIRFPAMNLQLPTIEMPAFFQTRTPPQMIIESAAAPFVSGQAATYAQVAPGGNLLQAPAPPTPEKAPEPKKEPAPPAKAPCTRPCPPCVPRCCPGRCAENEWQQRLQESERAAATLNQRMNRIESCLERIAAAQTETPAQRNMRGQIPALGHMGQQDNSNGWANGGAATTSSARPNPYPPGQPFRANASMHLRPIDQNIQRSGFAQSGDPGQEASLQTGVANQPALIQRMDAPQRLPPLPETNEFQPIPAAQGGLMPLGRN